MLEMKNMNRDKRYNLKWCQTITNWYIHHTHIIDWIELNWSKRQEFLCFNLIITVDVIWLSGCLLCKTSWRISLMCETLTISPSITVFIQYGGLLIFGTNCQISVFLANVKISLNLLQSWLLTGLNVETEG